jgi:hypothetical protein
MPTNWKRAERRAARTAKWATTMAKQQLTHVSGGKKPGTKAVVRWQLVDFLGPNGRESAGIIDVVAIRKDHRPGKNGLKPGDRLEIVLLQIKGGTARRPTSSDIVRMRRVAKAHGAAAVVLVEWQLKKALQYSRLKPGRTSPKDAWDQIDLEELFGVRACPGNARGLLSFARTPSRPE